MGTVSSSEFFEINKRGYLELYLDTRAITIVLELHDSNERLGTGNLLETMVNDAKPQEDRIKQDRLKRCKSLERIADNSMVKCM